MALDTETNFFEPTATDESHLEYRALSTGAVVSAIVGVASVAAIFAALSSIEGYLFVAPLPLVGLILGVRSLVKIRQSPQELTGQGLAGVGSLLSGGFLFGGLALAVFVYATEVPTGYERMSFTQMRPNEREQAQRLPVPQDLIQYQGKKVFIKGYMRPGAQSTFLDNFLLVKDNGACCFGDLAQVKYYDQIMVSLESPLRTNYSTNVFRLGGTLHVDPSAALPGSNRPVFSLTADYLK